ncbi:hypothetical protein KEM55_001621, partial [Ascosphaera atra]
AFRNIHDKEKVMKAINGPPLPKRRKKRQPPRRPARPPPEQCLEDLDTGIIVLPPGLDMVTKRDWRGRERTELVRVPVIQQPPAPPRKPYNRPRKPAEKPKEVRRIQSTPEVQSAPE